MYEAFYRHIMDRGWSPETYGTLPVPEQGCLYFWLWNFSRQLVGYQRYIPEGAKSQKHAKESSSDRYYTYITKPDDRNAHQAVWGLQSIHSTTKVLYVVEGVWDAISIQNLGYAAIAILGVSRSPRVIPFLRLIQYRYRTIAVCDNDENEQGLVLANFTTEYIITPSPFNDVNQMPPHELKDLLEI